VKYIFRLISVIFAVMIVTAYAATPEETPTTECDGRARRCGARSGDPLECAGSYRAQYLVPGSVTPPEFVCNPSLDSL